MDVRTLPAAELEGEALARWQDFQAAQPASVAHNTGGWIEVVRRMGTDTPHLLLAEEDGEIVGGLPAFEYRHPLGAVLSTIPSRGAYTTPTVRDDRDTGEVVGALVDAFRELAAELGCVTATIASNPFRPANDEAVRAQEPDFTFSNRIHYVDLDDYFDESGRVQLRDYHRRSNLSRNLADAEEAGLEVRASTDRQDLEEWYACHVGRMEEVGGDPLPFDLFEAMRAVGAERGTSGFLYVYDGGEMVGGGAYALNEDVVDIMMMSSVGAGLQKGANFLLTDRALRRARERGHRYYNWQASNPPTGGIVRFKEQWGSDTARYHYCTWETGDLTSLLDRPLEEIRQAYAGHYVFPFGLLDDPDQRHFSKLDSDAFGP